MARIELSLKIDTDHVDGVIAEFEALLPDLSDASLDAINAFVNSGEEFFRICGNDPVASATGEIIFRLELSDGFQSLMSTLGAGDG